MKSRVLLAALVVLAGLPAASVGAVAVGTATAPPAAAQAPTPGQGPVAIDIRAGAYPAGDPTAAGTIKEGDPETFDVSIYNPSEPTTPLSFGYAAKNIIKKPFKLVLYYGWGYGVVTENGCTNIASGNTSYCYEQSSGTYKKTSAATSWNPTSTVPAPSSGLKTLFFAVWLEAGGKTIAESNAGNIVFGLTAKRIFLTSTWGSGAQTVQAGTPVVLSACLTNGNCSTGLVSAGNFLADYLYVCDQWPPEGSRGTGLPAPGQLYAVGKADQVLGDIGQAFTPPAGQNWTNVYSAFASSLPNLATSTPTVCPNKPHAVRAGTASGITTNFASMDITWEGPIVSPPNVQLTVAPGTHPVAGSTVQLQATGLNPDGAQALYICARSGTSWLSLSKPAVNGYLADVSASSGSGAVTRALGTAVQAGRQGGTAQFIAFFSAAPSPPSSCPAPGTASASYGTLAPSEWSAEAGTWHASYDYSSVVNVTWPTAAAVPTPKVTLTVSPAKPTVGQTVYLSAKYQDAPAGAKELYICARQGTGQWLHLSGSSPYAAGASVPANSSVEGSAFSSSAKKATFVAFLSSRSGLASSGTCPPVDTASTAWGTERPPGWPASKAWDGAWDFSQAVTVTWGPGSPAPPSVNLQASTANASFGQDVVLTATYQGPGSANSIFICSPGSNTWLSTEDGGPWVAEQSLPALGTAEGYATGAPATGPRTAQFVAFLSSDQSPPASCPLTNSAGSPWGTTTSADYSNRVNVTWSPAPSGAHISLSASPANPGAGQRSTLTASYVNSAAANAAYICETAPVNGLVKLSGESPYLASSPVVPGSSGGRLSGWAKAASSGSATFVAYLSTRVGQQRSGACPSATGAGVIAVSSPVTVEWGSTPPPVAGAGPIVGITVNADQVPNGVPVTITATYEDPGVARALYVVDDGVIPPDFNYMDGFIYPKPAHLPYIANRPVPTFPDAAATIYGDNETVQFGAFLSTIYGLQAGPTYKNGDQTMVPAPAPGVVVPAVFGTTTPADFSPVISVTWGAPSVGSTITLTASNLHPSAAGDKVTFTAVASGMPSGDYLYVCPILGGSGSLKVEGPGPMIAGPSRSTTISGWASGDGTSADFIAFESPFGGWSNCWSSPYYPGDSLYSVPVVSNIVPVNWPAGPKKIYWFPT